MTERLVLSTGSPATEKPTDGRTRTTSLDDGQSPEEVERLLDSAAPAIVSGDHPVRELLEQLGVAVYTTDAEGRITQYNEAAAELWGRRPEIGTDLWCGSLKLFYPDGRPMPHDECPMAITLRENRPVRGEEAIAERPDGSRFNFLPFPSPIRDDSGKLIGAINVLVDITRWKRAEADARASEERFTKVFQASPAAMSIVRASDRRFVDVNDAFLRMLGYRRDEVIGRSVDELRLWADPHGRSRMEESLARRGSMRNTESRLYTRSGDARHVIGSAEIITLKDEVCVIVLVHDITTRIQAEQIQQQLRTDLARRLVEEQAINQIAALLRTTLDLQTVCEAALDAAMRLTGTEFGLIAAMDADAEEARLVAARGFKRRYLPQYRRITATSPTLLASVLFKGRAVFSPRKRLPASTARTFSELSVHRFALVPLVTHGSIVGALQVAGRDRSRWSNERRRFLKRIADQVALAIGSAQQYAQLERAFRLRDEGVRTIAHEIRTPLTAIKGFAQLALRQWERNGFDQEQMRDALEEINTAAERLSNLAVQMLSASSIEESLSRIQAEDCLLGPFLRDAVREFAGTDAPTNIRLQRTPRVRVPCDPQLIRQVIWNLLSNAVRHSPPNAEVVVKAARSDTDVTICVSDSGPGVPPRDRRRLFEKFFRGRKAHDDRDHQGIGLGLYLARQVIEAHDGKIWYEPSEPQGATFCFSLPLDGGTKK